MWAAKLQQIFMFTLQTFYLIVCVCMYIYVCVCVCVCIYIYMCVCVCVFVCVCVGRVAQSVQRLAAGWTVRGSDPGGARFSAVQTGPGAHPASLTMGTGSFPGVESDRGLKIVQNYTSTLPKGLRGL